MSEVYLDDARNLKKYISVKSIDVTITSPPYYDMKDYGRDKQIGFGQSYSEYLNDLKNIFKDVYDATKESGSLWVIIDSFKRNGSVIPLPFDFVREISNVGWKLQDIIIWKKDKTVPWSKKGNTRKIFEYILFFSKNSNFKYFSERVREYADLKEWWIRYPERYSPFGKSLEEIWEFNIPTQGSWGNKYIRHFCPLPEELVQRIITLTTEENDTVFDPFSGSGTVPSQAAFMNRNYYGFELNNNYLDMFNNYLNENINIRKEKYFNLRNNQHSKEFQKTIIKLRVLKYARVILKKLNAIGASIEKIYAEENIDSTHKFSNKNKFINANYLILIKNPSHKINVDTEIKKIIETPPLSKFGIEASITCINNINDFINKLPNDNIFAYSKTNTHNYTKKERKDNLPSNYPILSNIALEINEELYRG